MRLAAGARACYGILQRVEAGLCGASKGERAPAP